MKRALVIVAVVVASAIAGAFAAGWPPDRMPSYVNLAGLSDQL